MLITFVLEPVTPWRGQEWNLAYLLLNVVPLETQIAYSLSLCESHQVVHGQANNVLVLYEKNVSRSVFFFRARFWTDTGWLFPQRE